MGSSGLVDPSGDLSGDADIDLQEVVLGLHWDPPDNDLAKMPENLDAYCMLLDQQGRPLEVIHPGHLSNANGSVLHTGDSRCGASQWDDERVFVFLSALPAEVFSIAFAVVSASGAPFREIRGACCHVSDRASEREWVRCDLTLLGQQKACCVAVLRRESDGWKLAADPHPGGILAEPALLSLAADLRRLT